MTAGHNSGVAAEELLQFVQRVERLNEEKSGINSDISEVFSEMRGRGFDVKAVKAIIRLRAKDPAEREEEESILETYKRALGLS